MYKRVAVYDASTSANDLESQAEDIVNFISKGLHHGSVLVHCHHGVSRSTTCILLYLMRCVWFSFGLVFVWFGLALLNESVSWCVYVSCFCYICVSRNS